MNVTVNRIEENEPRTIARLVEIERQAFGDGGLDAWTLVPLLRHGLVLSLHDGNELVGGAQFIRDWTDPARAYLVGIAVDKAHRGKGLGTAFLAACLKVLEKEGIRVVELTVDPANAPARKVYQDKLGFSVTGERKKRVRSRERPAGHGAQIISGRIQGGGGE